MQAVYGDECVDISTVRHCVQSFKQKELVSVGIQKLDKCWRKCIDIEGDDVEM
jgi:hypothetical protein